MKKTIFFLIICMLGVLTATTIFSSEVTQSFQQDYDVNSYTIAYSENNETTYYHYGKGINETSTFELASNGKVVGAYIALALVEQGKIGLEEKIAPYLTSQLLTDDIRMNDITLKQLLNHTAGFSPSFELGVDKKLYSDPGSKFRYSGVGYIYLQNVIEKVSGMNLEQAATYYVFQPLGMKNSTFENRKTVTPYMNLSSAILFSLVMFLVIYLVLLVITATIGKITKFRFFTFKYGMLACITLASIGNILFLLLVFVSKVVILFLLYLLIIGI